MDDENDSLFGSPPPSPQRGRSPLLALPEDSGWRMENALLHTQNVGTIALPGSQNSLSEIPVQPAPPNVRPPFLKLRPTSVECNHRVELPSRCSTTTTPSTTPTPRAIRSKPLARKNSDRMNRTLTDLVGLIAHFGPAQSVKLPFSVHPKLDASQEGTKENPIEVDEVHKTPTPIDAVNNALIALASTVASALKLPTVSRDRSPLSEPAVHQVLQFIKHDPKLIPALQATHEYLDSIPRYPHHETRPLVNGASPSRPKRKRKQAIPRIPAGAEHWDVPFPFAPGHEPAGYPTQWQLERGRRVLGELLGLFERAFVQSRIKAPSFSQESPVEPPAKRPRISSVEPIFSAESSSINTPISDLPISPAHFFLDDISNIANIYSTDDAMHSQPPVMDFAQLFDSLDWQSLNSAPDFGLATDFTSLDSISATMRESPIETLSVFLESERSLNSLLSSTCVDLDSIESMYTYHRKLRNTHLPCGAAQSMQTIPTMSGSSSVREGTPSGPLPFEALAVPNLHLSSNNIFPVQMQRKTTSLIKAQEYRNCLMRELELTTLERWELQIENGVLLNLKKMMAGVP